MRRQPLEQHGCRVFETDTGREGNDPFRRDESVSGVGSGCENEGDAIPDCDVADTVADGLDDAGYFVGSVEEVASRL